MFNMKVLISFLSVFIIFCSHKHTKDYNSWRLELDKYNNLNYKIGIGACDVFKNLEESIECARKEALLNLINSIGSSVTSTALLITTDKEQKFSYEIKEKSLVSIYDVKYTKAHLGNIVSIAAILDLNKFKQSLIEKIKKYEKNLTNDNLNLVRLSLKELDKIWALNIALYPSESLINKTLILEARRKVEEYINKVKYYNNSKNSFISRAIESEGFKLTNKPNDNDVYISYSENISINKKDRSLYESIGFASVVLKSKNSFNELRTSTFVFYGQDSKLNEKRLKTKLGLEIEKLLVEFLNKDINI